MIARKEKPQAGDSSSPRSTALRVSTLRDAPRSNTPGDSVGCFAYGLGRFHDSRARMRARLQVRWFFDGSADTNRLEDADWQGRSVGQKGPTMGSSEPPPAIVLARASDYSRSVTLAAGAAIAPSLSFSARVDIFGRVAVTDP